jgi:hypothetical protein
MRLAFLSSRFGFALGTASLCAIYLLLQVLYVTRLPFVMDEFQGADTVVDLLRRVPYREYLPYKTLLGYYLQLPALLLGGLPWNGLVLTRLEMAFLNTGALCAAAVVLQRFYSRAAVTLGLAFTVLMSDFLERSSEIRVDMLTAWAGMFSLLAILAQRWMLAGLLAGLGFLVSQKGIYYCLAGAAACIVWGLQLEGRPRPTALLRFGAGAAVSLSVYLAFWAGISSWEAVYQAVFVTPQVVAFGDLYDIRVAFWFQTISRNPAFYAIGLIGCVHLMRGSADRPALVRDRTLLAFALVLLTLAVLHRQPWPYFFVLIIPTLLVVAVSFFDRHLRAPAEAEVRAASLVFPVLLLLGLLPPLRRIPVNLARDNGFQREMVELTDCVVGPGEGYLAGTDMVINDRQPVGSLRWVDARRLETFRRLDDAALAAVIDSVRAAGIKVVIDNYRIRSLPPALVAYLDADYAQFWGNLRIYAPTIEPGESVKEVIFAGVYSAEAMSGAELTVDGVSVSPGTSIRLAAGPHRFTSNSGFRLRLRVPDCEAVLDPRYREPRDLFPDVYTY